MRSRQRFFFSQLRNRPLEFHFRNIRRLLINWTRQPRSQCSLLPRNEPGWEQDGIETTRISMHFLSEVFDAAAIVVASAPFWPTFSLSLVTVAEVFAKGNSVQFNFRPLASFMQWTRSYASSAIYSFHCYFILFCLSISWYISYSFILLLSLPLSPVFDSSLIYSSALFSHCFIHDSCH